MEMEMEDKAESDISGDIVEQEVEKIASQLRKLGVRRNGFVLVHSSLKSLGTLDGGIESPILGLERALGPDGALLLPALSYENIDWSNPLFHFRRTPSCVGALPEYFRKRNGTLRSIHLTHSVCGTGRSAPQFLDSHIRCTTPCGSESPFALLAAAEGQILMLGCGLKPNTSMHGVEETVEPPYLFRSSDSEYSAIDQEGRIHTLRTRRHNFRDWVQRYDRVSNILDAGTELREGRVLSADCFLIEAKALWRKCRKVLERDPYYFVDRA